MGYAHAITFPRSVCGNLRKMVKKQQFDKTAKKSGAKNLIIKKYFSENYAYFLPFLTLGERKKGVVLMGD